MNRWTLFLMSIGFLFITLSYCVDKPYTFIIGGAILVVISGVQLIRDKKKK